jgi:hypothetical protein
LLLALFFELQFSDYDTVFTSIFSKLFIKSVKFKIFTNAVISQPFFLNSTIDNYNTRQTPQGRIKAGKRGTYTKDIHVWVYTSAFAKRFGMPQEWVDYTSKSSR